MTRRLVVAVIVCALAAMGTALGANPAAEKEIMAVEDAFAAAWNKDDAKAMAVAWAPDGDLINPFGRWARGRAEVEKLLGEEHSTTMKGSTYAVADMKVRFVSPAVAIVDWEGTITGMHNGDGSVAAPFKHHVAAVFAKKDGKWWIAAARPYAPLPPPPSATAPAR